MRTQEEILKFLENHSDVLGFTLDALLGALTFEKAHQFLEPEVTAEQFQKAFGDFDAQKMAVEYVPFAWEKIEGTEVSALHAPFTSSLHGLGILETIGYFNSCVMMLTMHLMALQW